MRRGGQLVGRARRRRGRCRRRPTIVRGERGVEEGYGDDKVEEVGLSETEFWGPEFDAEGAGWVLFY